MDLLIFFKKFDPLNHQNVYTVILLKKISFKNEYMVCLESLKSDHGMFSDPLTKLFVERFVANEDRFFMVFSSLM